MRAPGAAPSLSLVLTPPVVRRSYFVKAVPGITRGGEFPQGTECSCTYIDANDVTPAKLDEARRLRKPTVIVGALAHWTDERCSWDAEHLSTVDGDEERSNPLSLGMLPLTQVLSGYPLVSACMVMKRHSERVGQKFSDPDVKRAYRACMQGGRKFRRTRKNVYMPGLDASFLEKHRPYVDTDGFEVDLLQLNAKVADAAQRYIWGYKDPGYHNPQSLSWYGFQIPKWEWEWLTMVAKARQHCAKLELPWYLEPGTDSRGKAFDWEGNALGKIPLWKKRYADKLKSLNSKTSDLRDERASAPAPGGEGGGEEASVRGKMKDKTKDVDDLLVSLRKREKKADGVEESRKGHKNMRWYANGPGARSMVDLPLVTQGGTFNWWSPLNGLTLFATWPRYMHVQRSVFLEATNTAMFGTPALLDYWGFIHPILLEGEGPRFGSDEWDWSQARHNTTHIRAMVPASECLARTGDVYLNYGNWMSWMSPEPSFLAMGEETKPEKEDLAHFFVKALWHAVYFSSEHAILELVGVYQRLSAYSGDPGLLGATLAEIAAMRDLIVGDAPKTPIAAKEKWWWEKIGKALASAEEYIAAYQKLTAEEMGAMEEAARQIAERWQELGRKVDLGPLRDAVDVSTPLEAFVRNAGEWVSKALARSKAWVSQLIGGGGDESKLASAGDELPTTSSGAEL